MFQYVKFDGSLDKVEEKLTAKQLLPRKEVDDVLGGAEAWKDVDQTEASCPKCAHNRAYFKQVACVSRKKS